MPPVRLNEPLLQLAMTVRDARSFDAQVAALDALHSALGRCYDALAEAAGEPALEGAENDH